MLNGLFKKWRNKKYINEEILLELKNISKEIKNKKNKSINNILKIKTENGNLYFVIPNISCISGIQEEVFNDNKIYIIEIYTQENKIQISLNSETRAKNRHKQILQLIEQWWKENG